MKITKIHPKNSTPEGVLDALIVRGVDKSHISSLVTQVSNLLIDLLEVDETPLEVEIWIRRYQKENSQ